MAKFDRVSLRTAASRGIQKMCNSSLNKNNNKKSLVKLVLLPDFSKRNHISLVETFTGVCVICFLVLFTETPVDLANSLASCSTRVCIFLHPVINVLGLNEIPSILLSHFISAYAVLFSMCVL